MNVNNCNPLYKIQPAKFPTGMDGVRTHEVPTLAEELLAADGFWERRVSFLLPSTVL